MLALALVPLFALSDRGVGGGWRRSYSFALALAGSALIAWALHLWPVFVMGVAWMFYRSLPFQGVFGSTTPRGPVIWATLFRHSIPAIVAVVLGVNGLGFSLAGTLAGYAVGATALGIEHAAIVDQHVRRGEPGGNENAYIEAIRGGLFGLTLALWVLLLR